MALQDDIDTFVARLQTVATKSEVIKSEIEDIAEAKDIAVEESVDTPISVLQKIDSGTIKTPTGTLNISGNNTYDVTNYASAVVNVPSSFADVAKGLADGSLTSFSAPALGVTSLKDSRFNGFTSLQTLDLTGVTDISQYTASSCTGLTSLTLDNNTTNIGDFAFQNCNNNNLAINLNMNGSVGQYAFSNAKIRSVKGTYSSIGSHAFYWSGPQDSKLDEVDIKVNGAIREYAFGTSNTKVSNFNLDPTSVITELESRAFYSFGSRRENASTNVFDLDFRNSTFTSIGGNAFAGGNSSYKNKYMNIYFPSTMTTTTNYVFQYTEHLNIYYKNVPSLSSTNVFQYATNFKNFFPYNLIQTAKTSTNWSSSTNNIVSSIFGYAAENTFSLGDTLPDTDADGYALTWYSDVSMTQQVTTVSDPTQMYYCAVGSKIKVPLSITQYQATCVVSDGVNTYTSGDLVPIGSTLTITAVGDTGYPDPYIFTLNGTTISSGDTYTTTSTPITITCIYYDGVNPPINPVFADNTWQQLAVAFSLGLHRTYWPITSGSTVSKQATLTDGTVVNLRLADSTANRYEFSDNSGYSQAVLEFDVCIPTQYRMNATGTNAGGWPASEMSSQTMGIVYNMLPNDLKPLVKQVKVPSSAGDRSGTIVYADNYCFLPSASELYPYSTYNSVAFNEGAIYQYYSNTNNSAKIKQRSGTNTSWYLRSPYLGASNYYCLVTEAGAVYGNIIYPTQPLGVSVCLVIG